MNVSYDIHCRIGNSYRIFHTVCLNLALTHLRNKGYKILSIDYVCN